jgi:tetratricopeptide (TPR) repeat protein
VLRALEGGEPVTPDSAPNRSVRWRLAVGAVAVAVLAGLAGLAISSSAGERLPGEQVTGSITEGANSKIAKAQQLVSDGEVLEAIQLYDEVLADDSQHPVALAQRGWLVSRAGLLDEGLTYVDRAIASEPAYAEARFFRSMILREQGDRDGAAQELRALLALEPPAQLAELAETLLAELEAGASP